MKQNSKRFSLDKADVKKVALNASVFLAPALLVFLVSIQSGASVDNSMYAVYLWLLNTSIDLLRKFIRE